MPSLLRGPGAPALVLEGTELGACIGSFYTSDCEYLECPLNWHLKAPKPGECPSWRALGQIPKGGHTEELVFTQARFDILSFTKCWLRAH